MAGRSLLSRAAVCCIAAVTAALAGCAASPARPAGTRTTAPAVSRSASASPTAQAADAVAPLAAGQQGTQQQVPWAQVGPGWFLAEWLPAVTPTVPTSLFLVDPAGGRYLIETLPANPSGSTPYQLVSWSGDGQRALLESVATPLTVAVLDLRTLATTELELGSGVVPIGFTAPDGLAIIANSSNGSGQLLERFSLTGQLELSFPASFSDGGGTYEGSALYTPDGTELAVGTSTGIELMSNDGQSLGFLPVSPSVSGCSALRWWSTGVLLARCAPAGLEIPQLWLVPISGATPTALTASPPASGDLGDLDAWQLPAGTYVQDAGACGYIYLAELAPDGLTSPVAVPGVTGDSTIVLGAQGNSLGIDAHSPCSAGASLLWYAPATNSVTPLLGGAVGGGTVENAIMFGQP
jgi:hypothetical protein